MKRKIQFYMLFLTMIGFLIIANSCSGSVAALPQDDQVMVQNPQNAYPQPEQPVTNDAYPVQPIEPEDPIEVPPTDEAPIKQIPADGIVLGEERAYVDSMDIFIMESFPVQVSVQVYGNFPDGCTSYKDAQVMYDEKTQTFDVHLFTTRPKDSMCTQALVPFEENIKLDVYGLPAGTYTVKVSGLQDTFTLDMDNK